MATTNIRIAAALVDAIVQQKAVLFAGAGISRAALNMNRETLTNRIGEEIRRDHPDYEYRSGQPR
jgi:hypothetical protein